MESKIWVGVYRRLDNRTEGLSDDSPRAVELHNRRKKALHDALGQSPAWQVEDWGQTDDENTHEFIEIAISIITHPTFQAIALPTLVYLGEKLLDAGVDALVIEPIKEVITRLRGKQKQEEILDYHVKTKDGINIVVYPKDEDATVTIQIKKKEPITIRINASQEEIDKLKEPGE